MLPSSPPGLSAKDVEKLITAAITEYDQPGKTGWVYGPVVSLSGMNAVDLLGVPTYANEVSIKINRASGNYSGDIGISIQVFNSSGGLINAGYRYYVSRLRGSILSGGASSSFASNNTRCPVSISMAQVDFVSSRIDLSRLSPAEWDGAVITHNPLEGIFLSGFQTPAVGEGITGVRLNIALGSFDAGTAQLSWRT